MLVNVIHPRRSREPTVAASMVRDQFGLSLETTETVIARDLDVPVQSGQVVAFVGPSGSGKSSLLRAVAGQLEQVLWIDRLDLPSERLVDALPTTWERGMELLTRCGLGEPQLMLRAADELSDGERARFRLALGLAHQPNWLAVDEFTAILDRPLARVVAGTLGRQARRQGVGVLVATTHEDVLDDLQPDVLVRCELGASPQVMEGAPKKNGSALKPNCPSRPDRNATGRTLLGGITATPSCPLSAA